MYCSVLLVYIQYWTTVQGYIQYWTTVQGYIQYCTVVYVHAVSSRLPSPVQALPVHLLRRLPLSALSPSVVFLSNALTLCAQLLFVLVSGAGQPCFPYDPLLVAGL